MCTVVTGGDLVSSSRTRHDEPLTAAEREKLISDGATIQAIVMHNEPSPADHQRSQVRVDVKFKDGQSLEFTEELDGLYQPAPGSPEAA